MMIGSLTTKYWEKNKTCVAKHCLKKKKAKLAIKPNKKRKQFCQLQLNYILLMLEGTTDLL